MRPLRQSSTPTGAFSRFLSVHIPGSISYNTKSQKFSVKFTSDGDIPFPQIIFRPNGNEIIFNNDKIRLVKKNEYAAEIPEGLLPLGTHTVQIEGCRRKEWQQSTGDDWIKWFGEIKVLQEPTIPSASNTMVSSSKKKN